MTPEQKNDKSFHISRANLSPTPDPEHVQTTVFPPDSPKAKPASEKSFTQWAYDFNAVAKSKCFDNGLATYDGLLHTAIRDLPADKLETILAAVRQSPSLDDHASVVALMDALGLKELT